MANNIVNKSLFKKKIQEFYLSDKLVLLSSENNYKFVRFLSKYREKKLIVRNIYFLRNSILYFKSYVIITVHIAYIVKQNTRLEYEKKNRKSRMKKIKHNRFNVL